jgi:hypothetical protein
VLEKFKVEQDKIKVNSGEYAFVEHKMEQLTKRVVVLEKLGREKKKRRGSLLINLSLSTSLILPMHYFFRQGADFCIFSEKQCLDENLLDK